MAETEYWDSSSDDDTATAAKHTLTSCHLSTLHHMNKNVANKATNIICSNHKLKPSKKLGGPETFQMSKQTTKQAQRTSAMGATKAAGRHTAPKPQSGCLSTQLGKQPHLITQGDEAAACPSSQSMLTELLTFGDEDAAHPSTGGPGTTTSRDEDTAHPTGGYMTTQ